MKRYNTRFIFYTTKSLKSKMKKRARELDIPMSDYIRTLVKQDLTINTISDTSTNQKENFKYLDNYNKKLSGQFRGLRWVKFMK